MGPEIVSMKIAIEQPPMFERIKEVFPMAVQPGVLFCWGDTIYNPSGIEIPDYLIAHETVHRKQQEIAYRSIEDWWHRYLTDPHFRFEQELPAHIKEYQQFCVGRPRNLRRQYLRVVAERLSGPLYKHMVGYVEAKTLIKDGAHV
jgi:hypothetical protein